MVRGADYPATAEAKVTTATSMIAAVIAAHDAGDLDHEPLRWAVRMLERAAAQMQVGAVRS
jgi:hypothetical protein